MRTFQVSLVAVLTVVVLFAAGCAGTGQVSSWERHCEACHDGKTVLNENVVIGKEEISAKYRNMEEFLDACKGSASCMNILKHQEKLLREAGRELGIGNGMSR